MSGRRTERVVLDVTYDDTFGQPSTWAWHLGLTLGPGVARLATVFGRPGRLAPSLRDDLADARESLGRMTTRAVTAESERDGLTREVTRLRGCVTDALDSWDDPGMARGFLYAATGEPE